MNTIKLETRKYESKIGRQRITNKLRRQGIASAVFAMPVAPAPHFHRWDWRNISMRGVIELINERQGMIAVRTEHDEYSVLELLGGYSPEIGDVISGNLENLGGESVKNITQGEAWDVFIQDIHGSKQTALTMIS